MAGDVANAVSALALSIVIARFLGPTNRGLYFLVILTATTAAMLGELGASSATLAFGARGRVAPARLHGLAVTLALGAGSAAAVVLLVPHDFWSRSVLTGVDRRLLALAAVGVVPVVYTQVAVALLTALGLVPLLSGVRVAVAVLTPAVTVAALVVSRTPSAAAVAWLISSCVLAVALFVALARAGARPALPRRVTEIVGFGVRSQIGTLAHFGFLRVDVLFVSAQLGPRAVGLYSLASVLAEKMSLLGSALYGASASRIGSGHDRAAADLTARLVRLLLLTLVPIAVVLAAVAHPLLTAVFGDRFGAAAAPFALLLPGTVCLTLWYIISLYVVAGAQRPGVATAIQATALVVSVPAYYGAVRTWGMNGGAIVSSVTYGTVLALGAAFFVRSTDVRVRELLPRRREAGDLWAAMRGLRRA